MTGRKGPEAGASSPGLRRAGSTGTASRDHLTGSLARSDPALPGVSKNPEHPEPATQKNAGCADNRSLRFAWYRAGPARPLPDYSPGKQPAPPPPRPACPQPFSVAPDNSTG